MAQSYQTEVRGLSVHGFKLTIHLTHLTTKASTDHWYDVAIGSSQCHIGITLVNSESYIGIEINIHESKALYDKLFTQKEKIESETGLSFDWQRLDDKKASRIIYKVSSLDFDNHDNYPELMDEIINKVVIMRTVFRKYL